MGLKYPVNGEWVDIPEISCDPTQPVRWWPGTAEGQMQRDALPDKAAAISAKPKAPKDRRGENISLAKSVKPYRQPASHPWKRMKK